MVMPLNLIRNIRIARKEKIGLASIFSVGLIIIIVAIVCQPTTFLIS